VPTGPTPGKHRHDQCPGVAGDADCARWQRRLATKEGHWHPVLEKIVVDDEPGDLCVAKCADDASHAAGSWLDHLHQVRVAEVGDAVKHEARGGPPRDDRHWHALSGNGVPQQIESAHVRGGDDHPLSTNVSIVQDGEILDRDRHQRGQLLRREMFQSEQLAKIPGRHAKNLLHLGLQLRIRSLWAEHLSKVGDDVRPVNRRQPDPDIAGPIGDTIAHLVGKPSDYARDDVCDTDSEAIAELPRSLASVAFARAAQEAPHRGVDRRHRVFGFTRGRYRHNCH
jgi:hypothetical protein